MTQTIAAFVKGGAGIDAIDLRTIEVPAPGPGEATVRLHAATLNYRDLIVIRGQMAGLAKEPELIPLSCGAGEVVAVGEGVSRAKVGDRVSPIFATGWLNGPGMTMTMLGGSVDGTARQFGNFEAESLVVIPDELGDLEAATLPCAGLTAWNALFQHRPLQPGEWVLCPGTGGVSLAALQFAHAAGAQVVVTSSSDAKLARTHALGADVTVNYRATPDWPAAIRAELGGRGVDLVVDVVGVDALDAHLGLLAPGGLVATIGMLGSAFSWGAEQMADPRLARITVGNRTDHEAMLAFCAQHAIRPVVDAVYDLARLADAYRHLESGRFFGKIGVSLL